MIFPFIFQNLTPLKFSEHVQWLPHEYIAPSQRKGTLPIVKKRPQPVEQKAPGVKGSAVLNSTGVVGKLPILEALPFHIKSRALEERVDRFYWEMAPEYDIIDSLEKKGDVA